MKTEFTISQELFSLDIQKIRECNVKPLAAYTAIIDYCNDLLQRYRYEVLTRGFSGEESEIRFFKEEKQIPLTSFLYYLKLQDIELNFPKTNKTLQREYITAQIEIVHSFLKDHSDFLRYMGLEQTYLDQIYFTRKYFKAVLPKYPFYYRDPDFSTSHDLLLSEMRANNMYLNFLQEKLTQLESAEESVQRTSKLQWTSSKVALTELVYALYHSGAVNNGEITLKELVKNIEDLMGIELGDYHHNFLRLRERTNPVKFLDRLKSRLQERMQELDS